MRRQVGLAILLLSGLAGCGDGVRDSANAVVSAPASLLVGKEDQTAADTAREARVAKAARDIADIYVNQLEASVGRALADAEDHALRLELHRARLALASRMWAMATAESADESLLGAAAMTRLTRMALERRTATGANAPILAALRGAMLRAETGAWSLAADQTSAERLEALGGAIDAWSEQHPDPQAVFAVSLRDLAGDEAGGGKRSGGLLGLLTLDPFAGLDPTTRALHAARRSIERIAYRAERQTWVLRWQSELLSEELLDAPAMKRLLGDLGVVSRAGDSLAATAAALPGHLAQERQAVLQAVEANQGPLRELAAEVRATLVAGRETGEALDRLTGSITGLVARFAPAEAPTAEAAPADAAPSRPFDITEYQRAVEALGITAGRLDELVRSAQSAAASPLLDQRLAEASRAFDRALLRLALAAAALILLAGAVALAVRRLGR